VVDLRGAEVSYKTVLDLATANDRIAELEAALKAAREEIMWWVGEHGCCSGHEAGTITKIDLALGDKS
jgi:hypothetical protein